MAGLWKGLRVNTGAASLLAPSRVRTLVDGIGDSEIFGEMKPTIRHRLPDICLTVGENLGENPISVNGIGDSDMVLGEMRPRIRYRLPDILLMVGENLGKKTQQSNEPEQKIEPTPEHNYRSAGKRLSRLSYADACALKS
ncbi:hypothetical protein ANN_25495 [Periplaneta americana]|uniref:Uncharacterized protein n=1 Tax=Periplaneta americana TaxID=6978 RepID=A0ABQ8S1D2_PERAM|nr:hypothetical protein ANN_25495 [Periplaneta americana]